jgi:hypothetical protein
MLIISEFGGAIWALISPVNFEDEMSKAMEVSLSSYATDKAVVEKWKSLQKKVIFPGLYLLQSVNHIKYHQHQYRHHYPPQHHHHGISSFTCKGHKFDFYDYI